MPTGLDARPGRRTARWVAPVGLCGGAVCLLVGTAVYLGAALELPPAIWAEDTGGTGATALQEATPDAPLETRAGIQLPAVAKDLALAAVAVLGTILVSVGAVFALLERIGILTAGTVRRRDVETPEPRHDLPRPESLSGVAAPGRNDPAQGSARAPGHGTRPRGAGHLRVGCRPARRRSRPAAPSCPRCAQPRRRPKKRPQPNRPAGPSRPRLGSAGSYPKKQRGPTPASHRRSCAPPCTKPRRLHPRPSNRRRNQPGPGDLIEAWDDYRRLTGDGHFSPRGLQDVLDQWGLDADVDHGDRVGAGGAVLIVGTLGTRKSYVLPSFNKSPRAVADWFDDDSGGAP